jgi:hypothetical protein
MFNSEDSLSTSSSPAKKDPTSSQKTAPKVSHNPAEESANVGDIDEFEDFDDLDEVEDLGGSEMNRGPKRR